MNAQIDNESRAPNLWYTCAEHTQSCSTATMSGGDIAIKSDVGEGDSNAMAVEDLSPEASTLDSEMVNGNGAAAPTPQPILDSPSSSPITSSNSPTKRPSDSQTPKSEPEDAGVLGGEVTVKIENGKPKLARRASQKVISRPPALFDDLPDSTEEATSVFQVIKDCIYGSKYMGSSEHDALGCDCSAEWRKSMPRLCSGPSY